ncbi:hypothetical protein [Streptomyces sp. M41(2017)]|nr:hypothetical protein [Streptomyces sp. M41(2017)]
MNESNTIEISHPTLFPLSALQTKGYAQPEARTDEAEVDDENIGEAEAA